MGYVRALPKLISVVFFIIKVHLMLVNPVVYSYATRKPRQRQCQRAGSRLWSMVAIALCTGNPAQPSHSIMGSNFFWSSIIDFHTITIFKGQIFSFHPFVVVCSIWYLHKNIVKRKEQVNIFQKLVSLHQLTQNMMFFASVLTFKTMYVQKMFRACSFCIRAGKSINNRWVS